MSTKVITNTCLQLLRRYGTQHASLRAASLEDDGPVYVRAFMNILQNISKEEIVEYVLALIDDMLTENPKRARRLLQVKSFQDEDAYETFLRLLWKGNWFIQEKTCKILTAIVSIRPKARNCVLENGERTILDTSTNASAVSVACYDLSQLIQYHPAGRIVLADLKEKEQLMKLMVHENTEVRKNALVCFQRLFLRPRYA